MTLNVLFVIALGVFLFGVGAVLLDDSMDLLDIAVIWLTGIVAMVHLLKFEADV